MNEHTIFHTITGFELETYDWDMLRLYMEHDNDKDTLELIESLSQGYPDPAQAEVGFVFLMAWIKTSKS